MGENKLKVCVVLPAYNAARTLKDVYESVIRQSVDEIILVDDASKDTTAQISESLNIRTIVHPCNAGYGANQKTCYMEALRVGADIIVMVHPDNQYDPHFIPEMVRKIRDEKCDFVLGSRMIMPGGALKGGMPIWKFIANKILTRIENISLGVKATDLHTGYRAYSRKFLQTVPFLRNSNDFVFDTQIIAQSVAFGFRMAEVPVTTKYFPEASSVDFWTSLRYGLKTCWTMLQYVAHRCGMIECRLFKK